MTGYHTFEMCDNLLYYLTFENVDVLCTIIINSPLPGFSLDGGEDMFLTSSIS